MVVMMMIQSPSFHNISVFQSYQLSISPSLNTWDSSHHQGYIGTHSKSLFQELQGQSKVNTTDQEKMDIFSKHQFVISSIVGRLWKHFWIVSSQVPDVIVVTRKCKSWLGTFHPNCGTVSCSTKLTNWSRHLSPILFLISDLDNVDIWSG